MTWTYYHTPGSVEDVIKLLSESRAKIIAGATDLRLELEQGLHADLEALIDVSRIPGLDEITLDQQGWIHLGPLATHNRCADSELIIERAFALANACWQVGTPQIRTRGTIAGNLITGSPANDTITALMALGTTLNLKSVRGSRSIPLTDFYRNVRDVDIQRDEFLLDITFPALAKNDYSMFYKLSLRPAHAISVVNSAVSLRMDGDRITDAQIALGAVAPTVLHARKAETFLVGKVLTESVVHQASELAVESARPIDDIRASASYRTAMIKLCVRRCLEPISTHREREGYPGRRILLEMPSDRRPAAAVTTTHSGDSTIDTTVNGHRYCVKTAVHKSLLQMLREDLLLTGTKEGCAEGECGACTVILDGQAVLACLVPAPRAHGAVIRTVEGVSADDQLHPLQQAFVDDGAVQCGFCTPGFIMSGLMLLDEAEHPTMDEIKTGVSGNLCRCTGYYKILSAIERLAEGAEALKAAQAD